MRRFLTHSEEIAKITKLRFERFSIKVASEIIYKYFYSKAGNRNFVILPARAPACFKSLKPVFSVAASIANTRAVLILQELQRFLTVDFKCVLKQRACAVVTSRISRHGDRRSSRPNHAAYATSVAAFGMLRAVDDALKRGLV
jgi:hypothetical protein